MAPTLRVKLTTLVAAAALGLHLFTLIRWAVTQQERLGNHIEFSRYQHQIIDQRLKELESTTREIEKQIERIRR